MELVNVNVGLTFKVLLGGMSNEAVRNSQCTLNKGKVQHSFDI